MSFFLGIDAGGTKTTCALGDDNQILFRAAGGSIKPLRVSIEQAQENLSAVLNEIAAETGVDLKQIAASCIGTAGVRLPQTDGWMRQILSRCAAGEIVVCGDEEIALDAAFPGKTGVLAIAGTGSNVMGRTSKGEMLNVGGWGPILGDQASGHWIGVQSLRAAVRARDFNEPSMILDRVLEFWSTPSAEELINVVHRLPPPDFSELAKIVAECAEQDDGVALRVLKEGGRLLGEDAVEAFRRVRQLDPDGPIPGFAFIGSIIDKVAPVRQSFIDTIRRALSDVLILPEAVDALQGALWRARKAVA